MQLVLFYIKNSTRTGLTTQFMIHSIIYMKRHHRVINMRLAIGIGLAVSND